MPSWQKPQESSGMTGAPPGIEDVEFAVGSAGGGGREENWAVKSVSLASVSASPFDVE